jgi:uncharacterized protein
MKKEITYFEKTGEENTKSALLLAVDYAKTNDIKTIVISSSTGNSALKLKKLAPELNIVCVTYSNAVTYKDKLEAFEKNKPVLEEEKIIIVKNTHSFSGIDRAISNRYKTVMPSTMIADTLKLISEGTKVLVECVLMATDSGSIKVKEPILALGGTSKGVDTCMLIEPATTSNFFELGILEIICMPRIGGLVHG